LLSKHYLITDLHSLNVPVFINSSLVDLFLFFNLYLTNLTRSADYFILFYIILYRAFYIMKKIEKKNEWSVKLIR
jgi:hypothetical protein